jgi:drug/metabolite transporter (DMT)-like permease
MNRDALGLLLGFVGVLVFGATLPATRIAVAELDPWFVSAGRAAGAGLLAGLLIVVLRRPVPDRETLRRLGVIAICVAVGFPAFTGFAMQMLPAAHGGVVLGILPLATAALGALMYGERPGLRFWIAAVAGAAIVVGFTLREGGGGVEWGDLLLIGAVATSALGYAVSGSLSRRMPGWEVISWVLVIALPFNIPIALATWPRAPAAVSAQAWVAFAYVMLMSQFIGFFAWNAGLALGGIARVSQVQLLQTFVTLVLAAVINRESVPLAAWVAACAVVAAIVIARGGRPGARA